MDSTVSAEGTVAVAQTDDLNFTSGGTVTAVNVAAGDAVNAGRCSRRSTPTQLAAAVTTANSTVADAKAKLADDQAAGASSDQMVADITSVATANDSLISALTGWPGAAGAATSTGTVADGERDRRRAAVLEPGVGGHVGHRVGPRVGPVGLDASDRAAAGWAAGVWCSVERHQLVEQLDHAHDRGRDQRSIHRRRGSRHRDISNVAVGRTPPSP